VGEESFEVIRLVEFNFMFILLFYFARNAEQIDARTRFAADQFLSPMGGAWGRLCF
jgi:hypothetical protein